MKLLSVSALAVTLVIQAALTPAQIAKRVGPAVVTIRTSSAAETSSGSGFIVDPSGTIVTNLHVVQGATTVAVRLPNGDIYDHVRVRAYDVRKDLAVIQIPGFGLPVIEFGDSDVVQPGQPVVLIGNPLGMLEGSVSTGVVSGVRVLEEAGFRVIQTDAAANPGNSGGPLIDAAGRVIGVLSFKLRGTESLNFVIPANYVRGLLLSADSFGLDELAKRLASQPGDLFVAAKPQVPGRWKSLASGTTKIVRVDGEHIYMETVLPDVQRQAGAFNLAEFKKSGDRYQGVGRSRFVCEYSATDWNTLGTKQVLNACTDEGAMEITLLTPTRIEGWSMARRPGGKFDCKKCQWNVGMVKQPFVWIPE